MTRGLVVEKAGRSAAAIVQLFRTATPDNAALSLENGARIAAGGGVEHGALAHLTRGRHYAYTVEDDSGALATGQFRAAPARASKFTFAVVGDFRQRVEPRGRGRPR